MSLLRDCLRFPFAYLMRFLRSRPEVHVRFHTYNLMSSEMVSGTSSVSFSLPPPSLLRSMEDSVLFLGPTLAECLRVLEWKAETRGNEGERKRGKNTLCDAPFNPPELSISSLLPEEVHSFSYANPRCECLCQPFCRHVCIDFLAC